MSFRITIGRTPAWVWGMVAAVTMAGAQTNNYKLSGGGSPVVNGIYFHTGSTYGELSRPKYQKADKDSTVYVYNAQWSGDGSYYWNIDRDLNDENDSYYYWNGAFDGTPTTFPVSTGVPNVWSNSGAGFGSGTPPTSTMLAIVTPTFTNGSSYTPAKVTPGSSNNIVGRFQLQGNTEGAVLQAVTVSIAGSPTGINASGVKLWSSSDNTFSAASDVLLSSKSYAASVTFNGFNTVVNNSASTYYFVTVDLAGGSTGSVTLTIPSQTSFTFAGANAPSSFSSAALSSGAVYLQNTTPTSSSTSVTGTEDTDRSFSASDFPYTDADGDVLTNIQITTLESAGSLFLDANSNGTIDGGEDVTLNQVISAANIPLLKFRPAANGNGAPYATFGFKVGDASVYSSSAYTMTINITAVNDAPTASNGSVTINEDNDKTFAASDFNYSDVEGTAMSLVQITALPSAGTLYDDANTNGVVDGGETIALNGTVSKTNIDAGRLKFKPVANANGSPYTTFSFKVNDGSAYSVSSYTMTVNVTAVNDAPTASNGSVTINEDNDKTFAASDFNYSDVEGTAMSLVQITALPSAGTLYDDANTNGVVDGGETIALNGTVSKTNIDAGRLKFKPAANANGSPYTTFSFKVNDGTASSASSYTMTVNVTAVNDAPTASNGSVTISEDNDKTFASTDFNYSDVEGTAMSLVQITALPSAGTLYDDANTNGVVDGGETIALNGTVSKTNIDAGRLKFKPAANANGSPYTTFTFKVNDGSAYSASSYTMTLNVTAVNDPPTASNNSVTISEDNDKTFAAADFNYNDIEGTAMSVVKITALPAAGTLYNDANTNGAVDAGEALSLNGTVSKAHIDAGRLKFKPAANGNGSPYTTFTFAVSDGTDYSLSSYTMTVNVTAVNDPPTAANSSVTTNEDTDAVFAASDFNYNDPEGAPMASVQVTALPLAGTLYHDANGNGVVDGGEAMAVNGTVTKTEIDAHRFRFAPAADSSGSPYASFTFTVNDGTTSSLSAYTMTVNVTAVNDAPTAADNSVTTAEDTEKIFAVTDFPYADKEGTAMDHITITAIPAAGLLYVDANGNGSYTSGEELSNGASVTAANITAGKLRFRPAADANGTPYTTFTFTVSDGALSSTPAKTMTVNVTPVPDISFVGGSAYVPPTVVQNSNNNPVGRFLLSGDQAGATLAAVTITFDTEPAQVTGVTLWSSADATFNSGTDSLLGTQSVSGTTVTFSGLTSSIAASGTYYFVALNLGAATGTVQLSIASTAHVTIGSGTLTGNITNALLSDGGLPLPVQLTSFTVTEEGSHALLTWRTAAEVNNTGFVVERMLVRSKHPSPDTEAAPVRVSAGFVEGGGTRNDPKEYSFRDADLAAGTYRYRLKQTDRDGGIAYGPETEVTLGTAPTVFVLEQNFPNPFNPSTALTFAVPKNGRAVLKIYNVLGQEMATLFDGVAESGTYYRVQFDGAQFSSGLYLARLQSEDHVQIRKMLLLK